MGSAVTMVGRDTEQARLSAFVRAEAGTCLLLRGESGVGKSALLDYAAAVGGREGRLVVRATGVETEAELPYAGLGQVLYPLVCGTPRLDDAGAVYDVVFDRANGAPPSVVTLGLGVLRLLSSVSATRPLLIILDDVHWLDDASAAVCGFVGRRLADLRVKVLVAARTDVLGSPSLTAAPLTQAPVTRLGDNHAASLLDRHHPTLSGSVRRHVLEQARGNPLALLELPGHLAGPLGEVVPDDLLHRGGVPLPRRLQHVYGARIAGLGDTLRAELLKGALDGAGAGPAYGAAPWARYRMRDAGEAVASGLLVADPDTGELAFRHPLVRTSVIRLATPDQRRAAHGALALVHRDDPDRHATHLAAAVVDPDEEVAGVLEAAAESATRRGGARAAVTWLTRAAELSEDPANRSRRLDDAAFVAGHTARLGQAHRLVRANPAPGSDESPAAVLASGYLTLYQDGDVRATHSRLTAAIRKLRDGGSDGQPETLDRLVVLLLAVSQYAGDRSLWERTRFLLASLGDLATERLRMYGDTWSDVVRHGAGWSAPVERATANLEGQEPWDITRLAVSAYHLDVLSPVRPHLQRVVSRELETGAMSSGMIMLHLILLDQMAAGEWDAAERTGERALALQAEHGHDLFAHQTRGYLAQLAALRGRTGEARDLCAAVEEWARPRDVGLLHRITKSAKVTAALSDGDYEAAYRHATGITAPGTFQPYEHQASRTLFDLVEAALRTGRVRQAREHALAARDAGLPGVSPRLAVLTYGALAITADDQEEAADMFARAESHPAGARFPFELARIRSAYGSRVRRRESGAAARRPLSLAVASFDRLGATAWADRARTELRAARPAAGVPVRARVPLTPQEHEIADLAACGLTNEEIGERTRLSRRTVETRLYRVFAVLGVTRRDALRAALNQSDGASATVPG
ncbi:LuxR family transcriptional regulator [Streptomyces sp. E5N91]|uniref:ATP-binding protein n=1 Tax=Streptomyces sp. E5N91 TaxID=1851996 RepID=UPI000EF55D3D|nr:LuxR family transcriptional regulator [Streptomyces sp. E5N91]